MQCPSCDFQAEQATFGDPARCPECGVFYEKALKLKKRTPTRSAPIGGPVDVDGERVFLDAHGVKVTNARFLANGRTYAMASVNSVRVVATDKTPSKGKAIAALVVGILGLSNMMNPEFRSVIGIAIFVGITALGVALLRRIKKRFLFTIVLTTSSGESAALESFSEDDIRLVEKALNDAIIHRG